MTIATLDENSGHLRSPTRVRECSFVTEIVSLSWSTHDLNFKNREQKNGVVDTSKSLSLFISQYGVPRGLLKGSKGDSSILKKFPSSIRTKKNASGFRPGPSDLRGILHM